MGFSLSLPAPLQLRPLSDADAELAFAVFVAGREAEFAALALPPQQKAQFMRLQFQAQSLAYRSQYPEAEYQLILREGQGIGRMLVAEQAAAWVLVDIGLLPEFQGQGLGAAIINSLLAAAFSLSLPVDLQVFYNNPALRLYQRLGFRLLEPQENAPYLRMRAGCAL
jgi:GNAT superfamily N-acetyltransferase